MLDPRSILCTEAHRYLSELPDQCVDLLVADPAYGLGKAEWDHEPDYGAWLQNARRILKPSGTAYIFGMPEIIAAHWSRFPSPKRWLTWHVTNRTSPSAKSWQATQEAIVMLWTGKAPWFDCEAVREPYTPGYEHSKGRKRVASPGRYGARPSTYSAASGALPRDVIRGPGLSGPTGKRESLGHPCQKPLWLAERLVRASCPPGGLVLDLFAGTASVSVAAHRLGRDWIAVEQDMKWVEAARTRLKQEGASAKIIRIQPAQTPSEAQAWREQIERQLTRLEAKIGWMSGSEDSI